MLLDAPMLWVIAFPCCFLGTLQKPGIILLTFSANLSAIDHTSPGAGHANLKMKSPHLWDVLHQSADQCP